MKKVVIIDNYDSFTYNLVHLVNEILGGDVDVIKNDKFEMNELKKYDYIILSPGPGIPDEAGLLKSVIKEYAPSKKILGVCLGLQAIGEVFGGKLKNLRKVYHGIKTKMIKTDISDPILEGIGDHFEAGRYHSWVIDNKFCPSDLLVTSKDSDGEIMAARHKDYLVFGVQFHPESVMTSDGRQMLINFLNV
ncbi:MAG: aminodeoxychorismate/anthranilate synthase component II [Saprospiraceae bacterium]|jgi:anthranilate synthase component 2|nr:aminodeoxychorismate/anthranilate synthase component II [Saprospiraceae bacterium]MBL0026138.1 aminodeoxychorismate/anthranilate synthase component II [Saprospiraceae bacterium]